LISASVRVSSVRAVLVEEVSEIGRDLVVSSFGRFGLASQRCFLVVVVVVGSSATWAAGGAAPVALVEDQRARRAVGAGLAILLVASIALLWF
jgi:hypothetical protein